MAKGKATGTAASAQLLAADEYRDVVLIMLQNEVVCSFGLIGEAAVIDEGIILAEIGDWVRLVGPQARGQINIIGNTASVTYQTGDVEIGRQANTP